jgi:hypothetical protein
MWYVQNFLKQSPARVKIVLLHVIQIGFGAHSVPYSMCIGAGVWSWLLTSKQFRGQENMDLYNSPYIYKFRVVFK